jgi:hypothetical protein
MRDILVSVSVLVLLCISTASAKKERQWQTGRLLDMKRFNVTFLAGDVIPLHTVGAIARSGINDIYLIDAGEYIYKSQEGRRSKDKTPPLTVNGPVQFATEKDHVYIKDEDGKEHDTKLIKKTLKGFAPDKRTGAWLPNPISLEKSCSRNVGAPAHTIE